MPGSVAFKCTYNDGGEDAQVGFAAVCSLDTIKKNVEGKHVQCASDACACSIFYHHGMNGQKPTRPPCMEARLFTDWRFGAGRYHHGDRKGELIHLKQARPGGFAILTTRLPGKPESDRQIIGLFRISEIKDQNRVEADTVGRVRLPKEEAEVLYYWAYASNDAGGPFWGSGLFRNLQDGQVHRILADIVETVRDEKTKATIGQLIKEAFGSRPAPPAAGCLSERSVNRQSAIVSARKYGPGGEGKDHREMKEWVAQHPEALGLTDVVSYELEHVFKSGDAVDLVFHREHGRQTVVEIETTIPMPGAHQVIKYRALLCAERNLPLSSEKISGVLVAWSIPDVVQSFCGKYSIDVRECRTPLTARTS